METGSAAHSGHVNKQRWNIILCHNVTSWDGRMVHLVSQLAAKPDLSSASRTPVLERSDPYKLSSDHHTCTVA